MRISSSGSTDGRPIVIVRRQLPSQTAEFHKPVDHPQQVLLRHVLLKRKLVKKGVLLNAAFPHHRLHPSLNDQSESAASTQHNPQFFNKIGHQLRFPSCWSDRPGQIG